MHERFIQVRILNSRLSLYKLLININSVRGAVACAQNKARRGPDKSCARAHVAFVYFLFAEFFFLFNRPAKLLGIYIVRMNLDVLQ